MRYRVWALAIAGLLVADVLRAQDDDDSPVPEIPETVVEGIAPQAAEGGAGGASAAPLAVSPMFPPSAPLDASNFPSPPNDAPRGRGQDLIGQARSASQGVFGQADLQHRPILRPGEIVESVPGMIVTQHSGSGKANQFFVRGFNLDHGTDFLVRVDGIPINLPSHGHGQGYLDINWLIPELIDYGEYKLGPYHADVGDFGSAGALDLHTRRTLPEGIAKVTAGQYDYYRVLAADSQPLAGGNLLYAFESVFYDGPWAIPENYNKVNGVVRWSAGDDYQGVAITGMAYRGDWSATNQISARAVAAGLVDRFGSLDPSDAGETTRVSLNGEYWRDDGDSVTKANAFVTYYQLDLFSNFTFFLEDPLNGDQIQQVDERVYSGVNLSRKLRAEAMDHTFGFQFRNDNIHDLQLNRTRRRAFLSTVRTDDVDQQSYALYYLNETQLADKVRSNVGVRGDFYRFHVNAGADPADSGAETDDVFSPKAGLVFGPWLETEFYLNWGQGFHSNDARGVTSAVDPAQPLVQSDGSEVGARSWLTRDWNTTLALWYLELDSELVFVGDAGTTEPGPASHRVGVTWTNQWRVQRWLTVDADYAWVRPRFMGGDRIPNAIENVLGAGLVAQEPEGGLFAGVRLRHYGPAALIEDNSARSNTTTVVNLQAGYEANPFGLMVEIFNLFDSDDNDITYFYESQPAGLPAAEDFHFHPVEPIMARATLTWRY